MDFKHRISTGKNSNCHVNRTESHPGSLSMHNYYSSRTSRNHYHEQQQQQQYSRESQISKPFSYYSKHPYSNHANQQREVEIDLDANYSDDHQNSGRFSQNYQNARIILIFKVFLLSFSLFELLIFIRVYSMMGSFIDDHMRQLTITSYYIAVCESILLFVYELDIISDCLIEFLLLSSYLKLNNRTTNGFGCKKAIVISLYVLNIFSCKRLSVGCHLYHMSKYLLEINLLCILIILIIVTLIVGFFEFFKFNEERRVNTYENVWDTKQTNEGLGAF